MSDDTKPILVYRAGNPIEGNFLKHLLEERGIPVTLKEPTLARPAVPTNDPGDAEIEIHVAANHLDPARRAVREYESQIDGEADDDSPWVCRRCGEDNEASFDSCWNCNARP